ncbi:hypothetical protein [Rhizobium tropici]|uniref:hypothetical protein n=1 Tax=Rhizobium tropici TaxID=398 RepID=UPI0032B2F8E7
MFVIAQVDMDADRIVGLIVRGGRYQKGEIRFAVLVPVADHGVDDAARNDGVFGSDRGCERKQNESAGK